MLLLHATHNRAAYRERSVHTAAGICLEERACLNHCRQDVLPPMRYRCYFVVCLKTPSQPAPTPSAFSVRMRSR